jgi:hypothetical protein
MKRLRFNWSAWHRRLGLVTCAGVVLWGLSGMSHPIMSRLQPKPVAFTAPTAPLDLTAAMPPQRALACHGLLKFQRLAVINFDGRVYYRVAADINSPARYFSAKDCTELAAGDEHHARQLASHYAGRPASEIVSARFITQFDNEYMDVNRLLPVWRIEFADSGHLRAYIDTDQARLATLIDDTRMVMGNIFRLGHNWAFMESTPRLQLAVMALVLGIALFSAVSGVTLYFRRCRHSRERLVHQPVRRWHRRLGSLVALTTLTFAGSGMFHLVMSYRQQAAPVPQTQPMIQATALSIQGWQQLVGQPAQRVDLVQSPAGLQWLLRNELPRARVAIMAHADHHPPSPDTPAAAALLPAGNDNDLPSDLLSLAQSQATQYEKLPAHTVVQTELITQFGGEYGFIFKRLPVAKVQFAAPGNPRYYIEPATGVLAAEIHDIDATEGKSFAYLHKWTWLDANKEVRDILMMLFALGNVLVALLGVWLFVRKGG